jgi:AcrR family transcriptional regulator
VLLARGTSQLTLAELGEALDERPRMLVHHFGSRDELIQAALQYARREMVGSVTGQIAARSVTDLPALVAELRAVVTAAANRPYFALFGEISSLVRQQPDRFPGFARASVYDWLPQLTDALKAGGRDESQAEAEATLALAIVRGLLLDENATGERDRIQAAYEAFAELPHGSRSPASSEGRDSRRGQRHHPAVRTVGTPDHRVPATALGDRVDPPAKQRLVERARGLDVARQQVIPGHGPRFIDDLGADELGRLPRDHHCPLRVRDRRHPTCREHI